MPFFVLLLKTKRPSTLMGHKVQLSNLLISSCIYSTVANDTEGWLLLLDRVEKICDLFFKNKKIRFFFI